VRCFTRSGLYPILIALCGCTTNYASLPVALSSAAPYILAPGDEIRISVFGVDAVSNSYTVSDGGTVSLPLLSTLHVEGRTSEEVERLIANELRSRDIAPRANVSVQITRYRPFYIMGEVQKPGEVPFRPGITILQAISVAGGYTFRADTKNIIVMRGASQRRARVSAADRVQPGDTILISERWF